MSDPTTSAEKAKAQIMLHERKIAEIRGQLRSLGPPDDPNAIPNSLIIAWLKTEGLPGTAQPTLKIQLSSPVEEKELNQLYHNENDDPDNNNNNNNTIVFHAVDTSTCTMTVSAMDADIPLGTSISYDLSTLIAVDNTSGELVQLELPVAILPSSSSDGGNPTSPDNDTEAICTMTLRLSFQPSIQDQRNKLYEKLNIETRNKATAVEELRQVALAASRQQQDSSGGSKAVSTAVQPGFLNRSSTNDDNKKPKNVFHKLSNWYHRTLGPNSLLRRTLPIAKNYIIFFGAVGLFHFRGQHLALPPPV